MFVSYYSPISLRKKQFGNVSEHVSPKSRLQVAVQESKFMDDGLINTSFQVVKPSVEQPQRRRELSLSTSESELELPNLTRKKSRL